MYSRREIGWRIVASLVIVGLGVVAIGFILTNPGMSDGCTVAWDAETMDVVFQAGGLIVIALRGGILMSGFSR